VPRREPVNVFEGSLGEDVVQASRRGEMLLSAPEVVRLLNRKRQELASARVTGHSFTSGGKGRETVVTAHVGISFPASPVGKDGQPQPAEVKVTVFKDGAFLPRTAPPSARRGSAVILARDRDMYNLAAKLAVQAAELAMTGPTVFTTPGKRESPTDDELRTRVMDRLSALLRTDLQAAHDRVEAGIDALVQDPSFRDEAESAYCDALREQVHRALEKFDGVRPDLMHRFVDEMYCRKIHDS